MPIRDANLMHTYPGRCQLVRIIAILEKLSDPGNRDSAVSEQWQAKYNKKKILQGKKCMQSLWN